MGERLIRQTNGHFSVFSDITDALSIFNATAEEIVELYVAEAAKRAREQAQQWVEGRAPGRRIYTPEEALKWAIVPDDDPDCDPETLATFRLRRDILRRQLAGEEVSEEEYTQACL